MFRLLNHVVRRQFRTWERPAQLAFVLAAALLVVMLLLVFLLPPADRPAALAAAGGVLLTLQLVILWANRGMVTPYNRAQRYYLAGEFTAARDELESERAAGTADYRTLTLLGNTYRQMGDLAKSKESLTEALQFEPNHHFPLYGFGRTLLVEGDYTAAAAALNSALAAGAPPIAQADLGEAWYRAGDQQRARAALTAAIIPAQAEPARALMVQYLRFRLGEGPAPEAELVDAGRAYWAATASRFAATPYGSSLMQDVLAFNQLSGEN